MNTEIDRATYKKRMDVLAGTAECLAERVRTLLGSVCGPPNSPCTTDATKAALNRYYCDLYNELDRPTDAIEAALASISETLDRIQI